MEIRRATINDAESAKKEFIEYVTTNYIGTPL